MLHHVNLSEKQKQRYLQDCSTYLGDHPYPPIPDDIWCSNGETRDWLALPDSITNTILCKLDQLYILEHAQFTCKSWYELCKHPAMWRIVDLGIVFRLAVNHHDYYDAMRLIAVDRAAGQVEAISVEDCNKLSCFLKIAERTGSSLKRLTLSNCHLEEDEWEQFLRTLPSLQVFEAAGACSFEEAIEALGRNCPDLHTLRWAHNYIWSDVTLAVSKNLPRLRHLFIYKVPVTIGGLEAMLDRCSLLESLDLRLCIDSSGSRSSDDDSECEEEENLDLRKWPPGLLKRCEKKMKFLRLPTDDDFPRGPIFFTKRWASRLSYAL